MEERAKRRQNTIGSYKLFTNNPNIVTSTPIRKLRAHSGITFEGNPKKLTVAKPFNFHMKLRSGKERPGAEPAKTNCKEKSDKDVAGTRRVTAVAYTRKLSEEMVEALTKAPEVLPRSNIPRISTRRFNKLVPNAPKSAASKRKENAPASENVEKFDAEVEKVNLKEKVAEIVTETKAVKSPSKEVPKELVKMSSAQPLRLNAEGSSEKDSEDLLPDVEFDLPKLVIKPSTSKDMPATICIETQRPKKPLSAHCGLRFHGNLRKVTKPQPFTFSSRLERKQNP